MRHTINSAPCLNCADRSIGCHGVCKDYIEFDKERRKQNKEKYKQKQSETLKFRPKYYK